MLNLSAEQMLTIETPGVTLHGGQPILNGTPLEGWTCEVVNSNADYMELRYISKELEPGAFGLRASPANAQGQIWIQYWME